MSSPQVYAIGDTHFGHRKIVGFEPTFRPFATIEEHDAELVRRWNATVKPTDIVWHLGDVVFGRDAFKYLGQLNGRKRLIMGNHDTYPLHLYAEHFDRIQGAWEYDDCIMTHIPVHEGQLKRYEFNIHGHLHSKSLPDPHYICLSAEHTDLRPVLLRDAINRARVALRTKS